MLATLVSDVAELATASANPVTGMLAGVKMARAVLPEVISVGGDVLRNLPDIERRFADLEAALAKAHTAAAGLDLASAAEDVGGAWKSAMSIYGDVGLSQPMVQAVLAAAIGASDRQGAGGAAAAALAAISKIAERTA